ncbi:hypothetical protein LIER_42809 [Lithospermum erythrorhizon]|uniref:Barwin domain-containing protein n=1 Tax=Lithospermum erythrorhizon TaxID=34254 RepID=A0AAV3NZY6_LITER
MMRKVTFLVTLLVALVTVAAAESGRNMMATREIYNPEQINWDLYAVSAYCSTWYGDEPLSWRKKSTIRSRLIGTAFCHPSPQGQRVCGQCLSVTNTATGAQETVTKDGHMFVDYEFVSCGD